MLPALVLSILYLIVQPPSADLAAQTFRADLFSSHGFVLWSNDWYSGHLVPGYSLLYPPLAAATSPRLVGAAAAVIAAGLFGAIARHRWATAPAWAHCGSAWRARRCSSAAVSRSRSASPSRSERCSRCSAAIAGGQRSWPC